MAETIKPGAPTIGEELKVFIESGCTVEVGPGKRKTLVDQLGRPVVEIDGKNRVAVFQDEYHQTAGAIDELNNLIAAFDNAGFRVAMD